MNAETESVLFVRLPRDEYEQLKKAAAADDRSISQAVRVALRAYLASEARA